MADRRPWLDAAPVRVGTPNVGDRARLHRLLDEILDRRWLTNHGPLEREFEERLCAVTATRHCIPVANATLGLLVAVKAAGVAGDVLVPSFTFPALPHVVALLGLRPVFCDIDESTHTLSVADVETQVSEGVGAAVGVHLWGRACDTDGLEAVLGDRPVLYDAAHAFGARHRDRPVGGRGRCEVFSFHATKAINAFEGGAVATDDDDLAEQIRLLVNFGFAGRDHVVGVGINAKLSEIHAAMGLVSLDLLPAVLAANAAHLEQYATLLAGVPGVRLVSEPGTGNASYVVIEVDRAAAGCTRDEVQAALRAEGVDAWRYFFPGCHRMPPYQAAGSRALPVTEAVVERVLQLPTGLAVDECDVARVCAVIRRVVETAGDAG